VTALSQLVGWVLAGFYSLVPSYAIAIILLGLSFMAMVVPLTLKSTRSMLAMQKLQPRMKQLQQQHKNDRLALNQAMTQLYKEEGVSPFGSCLPTLLPLPLFYVLYRVIEGLGNKACVKKVCHADPLYISHSTKMYRALVHNAPATGAQIHSFGMNLATSAWTALKGHVGAGEVFGALLLLLIMIGANYYQQVQITNLNPMVRQNQQMNSQLKLMRFFPIIFGLICIRLPSGLVLYYAVSALFRVGQQWLMYRYDPKVKALVKRDDRDLEIMEARLGPSNGSRGARATVPARAALASSAGGLAATTSARPNRPPRASGPSRSAGTGAQRQQKSSTPGGSQGAGPQRARGSSASASSQRNRNRRRRGK